VQRALLDGGVDLSLSNFSDVPQRHRFHRAVQLASLHRLIEPIVLPRVPNQAARGVRRAFEIMGAQGIFGVDRLVTQGEMAEMMNRARTASGTGKGEYIAESGTGTATRAMFLESVLRVFGLQGDFSEGVHAGVLNVLGVPEFFRTSPNFNRPITRGEAAEILMRAMTI